ncbi:hypothetical protein ACC691_36775, partial [Rhizobium johnstonii]|uniref:hypothetical protein n=1 Tax=Rhizobium johnstonii TaxID=3019933 RepID=UPI003F9AC328
MRFGFRRRGERVLKKFDPAQLPASTPPTVSEATEEGILLAEFSARMRLKNRLIVRILGEGRDFDEELFRADAREVLDGVRSEMTDAAERVADEAEAAATRSGRGSDMHDYHRGDVANLE